MEKHLEYTILGQTLDDAVGEAYDKVARYLGLGYPGGPVIDQLAETGENNITFPRPMLRDGYDFSFSGLKTAVINYVRNNPDAPIEDIATSFQEAVVEVLTVKARKAAIETKAKVFVLGVELPLTQDYARQYLISAWRMGFTHLFQVAPTALIMLQWLRLLGGEDFFMMARRS